MTTSTAETLARGKEWGFSAWCHCFRMEKCPMESAGVNDILSAGSTSQSRAAMMISGFLALRKVVGQKILFAASRVMMVLPHVQPCKFCVLVIDLPRTQYTTLHSFAPARPPVTALAVFILGVVCLVDLSTENRVDSTENTNGRDCTMLASTATMSSFLASDEIRIRQS